MEEIVLVRFVGEEGTKLMCVCVCVCEYKMK